MGKEPGQRCGLRSSCAPRNYPPICLPALTSVPSFRLSKRRKAPCPAPARPSDAALCAHAQSGFCVLAKRPIGAASPKIIKEAFNSARRCLQSRVLSALTLRQCCHTARAFFRAPCHIDSGKSFPLRERPHKSAPNQAVLSPIGTWQPDCSTLVREVAGHGCGHHHRSGSRKFCGGFRVAESGARGHIPHHEP